MSGSACRWWRPMLAVVGSLLLAVAASHPASAAGPAAIGAARGGFTFTPSVDPSCGQVSASLTGAITVDMPGRAPRTVSGTFALSVASQAPCPGPPAASASLSGPHTACAVQGYGVAEVVRTDPTVSIPRFSMPCSIAGVAVTITVGFSGVETSTSDIHARLHGNTAGSVNGRGVMCVGTTADACAPL